MAIGIATPDTVLETFQHIPGVHTIMNYFTSTKMQPQYKPNEAWNNPINDDAQGMFQLYYQNTHSIPWDDVLLGQDLQTLADFDVRCFCLSETNLDWQCHYVRNDFLSRQCRTWTYTKTSFSSIDMKLPTDYITGGTLTSRIGTWSSRVLSSEQDPSGMGRWSQITLTGKRNTKISIITGYRCIQNKGDDSASTHETIYMRDQHTALSPNPRKQFIVDLTKYIKAKQKQNHDIILNVDANEVIGEESQGIAKLIRECGLTDLLDAGKIDAAD